MADLKALGNAILALDDLKKEWAEEFLRRVKEKTPIKTGELRDSWEVRISDGTIYITNTAQNSEGKYYWFYLEYGTEFISPVAMIRTTFEEAEEITRIAREKAKL